MDRYSANWPRDDASRSDGDTVFVGVNMRLAPDQLPPGLVREAVNLTFRDGQAATRRGIRTPIHFNPRLSQPELDFPGGKLWGLGRYADAQGREWMLIARPEAAWRLRDGVTPVSIPFPETVTAECSFVQYANFVYLFRGENLKPWRWDGTPDGRWQPLNQLDPGNATTPIPGAVTAEVAGERLLIPSGRDAVLFSDLAEGQYYDTAKTIRVNRGSNDSLVRLFPYANGTVLAFKSRSVYLIENVLGDLANLAVTNISRAVGCVARRAVAQVGADVWFLGAAGVYRVSQVIQDRIQTDPVPLSEPMAPFFRDRVNWSAIAGAVATTLGEYFYLAVPIDGATTNNAIVRCHTATGSWEGYWTFAGGPGIEEGARISEFIEVDYRGRKRLFATEANPLNGLVYLLEEGLVDRVRDTVISIPARLVTRGYPVGTTEQKQFTRFGVGVLNWAPATTLLGLGLGIDTGAGASLVFRARGTAKYFTFGKPDYDTRNVNDDHGAPGRQQYRVLSSHNIQLRSNGVVFEQFARAEERVPTRQRGPWGSVVIETTNPWAITHVSVEARQTARTTRTVSVTKTT